MLEAKKIERAIHDCEFRLEVIQIRIDHGYGNQETEAMKENILLEIEALEALEKSMLIKEVLGNDCDLNRLRELVQADREGTLLVIGSKIEEAVYTPPADVAPIVHGRWIEVGFEAQDVFGKLPPVKVVRGYRCNVCNRFEREKEPYCHCGAKMNLMEDA